MTHEVLLYYWFTNLENPTEFAEQHRRFCEEHGLRGRILVAQEGLNGTVSGTKEACKAYREHLWADPRFVGMEFKIDEAEGHAFKALYVRVRPEIITLGVPLEAPVHERTGKHLEPEEWLEMMEKEEDIVILDGRNKYESDLGRFKGAITPPVDSFREFPRWLEENRKILEGKKVLTYCTGGIRCEKLTAYMIQAGFAEVYQLHGGIVQYGKHPKVSGEGFEGVNVVFDDRVVVPVGTKAQLITHCRQCQKPSANYVNCSNVDCNKRMILCEECEAIYGLACSDECRNAERKRIKGKKLYESVNGSQPESSKPRRRGKKSLATS